MKKYKLNEESLALMSKVLSPSGIDKMSKHTRTKTEWIEIGYPVESLEEVPQRIEVQMESDQSKNDVLVSSKGEWTEQERKDIEHLVNKELGHIEWIYILVNEYAEYYYKEEMPIVFEYWLKNKTE